jgi:hypothetical protein
MKFQLPSFKVPGGRAAGFSRLETPDRKLYL